MPVRHQKSARGGYMSIFAVAIVVAASLVNLKEYYLSVQGSHSSSKETKNPTPLPEAIPEFGLQVRINDQPYDMTDEAGGEMFRWRFQQRATFYSNLAEETHPKQKLSIPSSTCTVGNEVVLPNGETVGTSQGTCPDLEWGYVKVPGSNEQSFSGPTMNGEWNSPLFLYMDVALEVCNRTAAGEGGGYEGYGNWDESVKCAAAEEIKKVLAGKVEVSTLTGARVAYDGDKRSARCSHASPRTARATFPLVHTCVWVWLTHVCGRFPSSGTGG